MQLKAEEFCILITRTEPLLLASLLRSGGEDRMCMYVRIYVYIYIYVTWGFHAGISICKQGSILSSVALCKDSGSRARAKIFEREGEGRVDT